MVGTIVYRTFSSYNELYAQNITFYQFFYYKSCRPPTKGVMFSDSKYNILTIYDNFIKNVATSSFVICRALLYYKTTEFLHSGFGMAYSPVFTWMIYMVRDGPSFMQ